VARVEHAWLEGDLAGTAAAAAYELAAVREQAWPRGELAFWLWRGGAPVERRPDDPAPFAQAVEGDWRGAAEAWSRLGCPYERADALSGADDEDALLEALAGFDDLGAARAASRLRRRLRAMGSAGSRAARAPHRARGSPASRRARRRSSG
jgi:hypothetical protein